MIITKYEIAQALLQCICILQKIVGNYLYTLKQNYLPTNEANS